MTKKHEEDEDLLTCPTCGRSLEDDEDDEDDEDRQSQSMLEIRSLPATELRAAGSGAGALRIEGYASVFNQPALIPGAGGKPGFREIIKPGAFTRSVAQGADVVCLFNHDPNQVLGRTKAGTLRLRQDSKGLHYSCDLPNTQMARDLHESIQRGDISECSFAFKIPDGGQDWTEERDADGTYFIQRTISDVHVKDVSPVTYPAYSGTNVSARVAQVPAELRSAVEAKNAAERGRSNESDLERGQRIVKGWHKDSTTVMQRRRNILNLL